MPGGDGTGPLGQGPLTGRGMGYCRRGAGFRGGFGYRSRARFVGGISREERIKILEAEKEDIEQEIKALEK